MQPSSTPPADALVVFTPSGKRGRFVLGTPLLDAARSLGVYVESVCGGRAICGRCQVVPTFGAFAKHGLTSAATHMSDTGDAERRYAEKRTLPADRRLSCQTRIAGDLVIDVPPDVAINSQVVRKAAEALDITCAPSVRLCTLQLAPAGLDQPLGAFDRTKAMLATEQGVSLASADLHALEALQPAMARGDGQITIAIHDDGAGATLTAVWPGRVEHVYGIACDIGSTTIALHLMDLATGATLASAGATNPQIRFGEDLMSRVSYVMMNPDGRTALTQVVREAIGTLVQRVTAEAQVPGDRILDAVFVGNPVMHHLFLGLDPTPLGQAPFELAVSSALSLKASDLGLPLARGARIYMLPCIAGHVGADAAAVALAVGPQRHDETTLVVDVGTNAEILLGNKSRVLAASSPTGPAFEGAQISGGQRAAPGAIERVRIDPVTLEPRVRIIGSEQWSDAAEFAIDTAAIGVTGICGSGIIEVIGEMFLAGIIAADGTIRGALSATSPRIIADGRTFSYRLWDGPIEIRITQTDVRAIQLAKGALYAGIRLLMQHLGVNTIDRIKLAGAFGAHIDPKYAVLIGLVPDCDLARVAAVGNAAGTGARMALINRDARRSVEALVDRIEKIETALEPEFQRQFVGAMAFPHASDAFEHLAKVVALPVRAGSDESGPGRRRSRRR